MALSNIFREPQREITESLIGIALFGVAMAADYAFADWFVVAAGAPPPRFAGIALGIVIGVFLTFAGIALLFITHFIGEAICNAIQRNGIHLRPRDRHN